MAKDGSVIIEIDGDSGKFEKALSGLGSVTSGALKGVGTVAAAATTAIVAMGTAAVNSYAEYEQLVGGVETLFKDSSDIVQQYAANAYKTAGMSANQYMETVTSFSASLLQSVGGDTEEAARIADMAITDMSDNANKMGTDIQRIQDAYQGFAKQNYTMLDNLKLGYGGTKAEMERLLEDAEKLSGIKYDINNLNDVYNAIHVIQTELGITGTTAQEAGTTIQGSFSMMQAAWQNLLVGMADETQNFDVLLTNFMESVGTFADNLLPRVEIVLEGIVKLVSGLGPKIAEMLPGLLDSILPGLIEGVTGIASAIAEMLPGLLETLITVLTEQGPALIQAGAEVIQALTQGIIDSLPLIMESAVSIIEWLVDTVATNLPQIIESGVKMLNSFVRGIGDAMPDLIETTKRIVSTIVDAIIETDWSNLGMGILDAIISGILYVFQLLTATAIAICTTIADAIANTPWFQKGVEILTAITNGIGNMIGYLGSMAWNIANTVWNTITGTDWWSLGSNIISGIANGIAGAIGWLVDAAVNAAKSALNAAKSFLGIKSPSKVFAKEVGQWIPPGIGEGVEAAIPQLSEDMQRQLQDVVNDANLAVASEVSSASAHMGTGSGSTDGGTAPQTITNDNGMTIVIYYTGTGEPEDIKRIGREIGAETTREMRRKGLPITT